MVKKDEDKIYYVLTAHFLFEHQQQQQLQKPPPLKNPSSSNGLVSHYHDIDITFQQN